MQIKTTMRYLSTIRVTETQNSDHTKAGEDPRQRELSPVAGKNIKWCGHSERRQLLTRIDAGSLCNPAAVLLGT